MDVVVKEPEIKLSFAVAPSSALTTGNVPITANFINDNGHICANSLLALSLRPRYLKDSRLWPNGFLGVYVVGQFPSEAPGRFTKQFTRYKYRAKSLKNCSDFSNIRKRYLEDAAT